jgi:hypothetical protein
MYVNCRLRLSAAAWSWCAVVRLHSGLPPQPVHQISISMPYNGLFPHASFLILAILSGVVALILKREGGRSVVRCLLEFYRFPQFTLAAHCFPPFSPHSSRHIIYAKRRRFLNRGILLSTQVQRRCQDERTFDGFDLTPFSALFWRWFQRQLSVLFTCVKIAFSIF